MKLKQFTKPTQTEIENYVTPDPDKPWIEGVDITSEYSKSWTAIKKEVEALQYKAYCLRYYAEWASTTPEQRNTRKWNLSELDVRHFRAEYPEETAAIDAGRGHSYDYYLAEERALGFVVTAMQLEFVEETHPDVEDEWLYKHPDGRIGHIHGGLEEAEFRRSEEVLAEDLPMGVTRAFF